MYSRAQTEAGPDVPGQVKMRCGTVELTDHRLVRARGNIPNNSHYDSLRWCQSFIARSRRHSLRTPETNDALDCSS